MSDLKIVSTRQIGPNYIRVVAHRNRVWIVDGEENGGPIAYYFQNQWWAKMTPDHLQSDLQLLQHADIVIDPSTNRIIKCRWELSDLIEIVLEGW